LLAVQSLFLKPYEIETEKYMNDDESLRRRIHRLVDEEHGLENQASDQRSEADHARISAIEVELDQIWDLLRQRNARRTAGLSEDFASLRSSTTVEGYEQ
jgi:Protein of unknown function (DUF2630)